MTASDHFELQLAIPRVVFGAGSLAQLPNEIKRLGAKRALVLSTPEQQASAEQVAAMLGARAVIIGP